MAKWYEELEEERELIWAEESRGWTEEERECRAAAEEWLDNSHDVCRIQTYIEHNYESEHEGLVHLGQIILMGKQELIDSYLSCVEAWEIEDAHRIEQEKWENRPK